MRAGFLELKLHGDAGDLEMWFYERTGDSLFGAGGNAMPFDVPHPTVVKLAFTDEAHKVRRAPPRTYSSAPSTFPLRPGACSLHHP